MKTLKKPDPEMIDDEIPELDEEWFRRARSAREVLPEILGPKLAAELLSRKPGQRGPQKAPRKEPVTVRYSRDVLKRSRVGAIFINKDSAGSSDHFNRTMGVDATLGSR
jgi:uncharacterized protein (DUF4415 family)